MTAITDALHGVNPDLVLQIIVVGLLAWACLRMLAGLEGWVLLSSLTPWIYGFFLAAIGVVIGGAYVLFLKTQIPSNNIPAWVVLGVVTVVVGIFFARLFVWIFWKTWWLRVFLCGGLMGAIIYLAVIAGTSNAHGGDANASGMAAMNEFASRDAVGEFVANWPGLAKLAIAFAAGGAIYAAAYRLFYPILWLLMNVIQLTASAILVVTPGLRSAITVGGDQLATSEQVTSIIVSTWLTQVVVAVVSLLVTIYAMVIQRFSRNFREFFSKAWKTQWRKIGLPRMLANSLETAFATLGGMLTFKRYPEKLSRTLEYVEKKAKEAKTAKAATKDGDNGGDAKGKK